MTDSSDHRSDHSPSAGRVDPEVDLSEAIIAKDLEATPDHADHDRDSVLPPNRAADTAYGPVRGSDPAHPEGSSAT